MNNASDKEITTLPGRVNSIDFFRGLTMFLLVGESSRLYSQFHSPDVTNAFIQFLGVQFSHHEWAGLHFWDLIQPFFMFIVGVSIPFSVANRLRRGDSENSVLMHAIKRSLLLLLFGWILGFLGSGKIAFRFQNVLAQLSVTYLIAFLIQKRSAWFQIIFTVVILLLTDIAYRVFPVAGFNQPFVPDQNLGAWVDMQISGELSSGHWVSLNAIPTTAHTVWGVLFGKLLMSNRTSGEKIRLMLISGFIALLVGYSLHYSGVTPIIKRIATSSFVFASGGWTILALCLSYWLIDVKRSVSWTKMFMIVGMNSLFIYLFANAGGAGMIQRIIIPFTRAFFSLGTEMTVGIVTAILVWAGMWGVCYWIYRNKIFIRI